MDAFSFSLGSDNTAFLPPNSIMRKQIFFAFLITPYRIEADSKAQID